MKKIFSIHVKINGRMFQLTEDGKSLSPLTGNHTNETEPFITSDLKLQRDLIQQLKETYGEDYVFHAECKWISTSSNGPENLNEDPSYFRKKLNLGETHVE